MMFSGEACFVHFAACYGFSQDFTDSGTHAQRVAAFCALKMGDDDKSPLGCSAEKPGGRRLRRRLLAAQRLRTLIYRIVSGEQPPGRQMLSALADHPKGNPAWLLSGSGEPLLAERDDGVSGGWLLPIAREPLPGAPEDHRDRLSDDKFPVPGSFYRSTPY